MYRDGRGRRLCFPYKGDEIRERKALEAILLEERLEVHSQFRSDGSNGLRLVVVHKKQCKVTRLRTVVWNSFLEPQNDSLLHEVVGGLRA